MKWRGLVKSTTRTTTLPTEFEQREEAFRDAYGVELWDVMSTEDPIWQMRYAYHPADAVKQELALNPNLFKHDAVWIPVRLMNYGNATTRHNIIASMYTPTDFVVQFLGTLNPQDVDVLSDFHAAMKRQEHLREDGLSTEPAVEAFLSPELVALVKNEFPD